MESTKEVLKVFVKKHFESFAYFYSHLGHRVFIVITLSIIIGILDGFGLTMFLPLLQVVGDSSNINPEDLGNLRFLVEWLQKTGLPLTLLSVLFFMMIFFFAKGVVQYLAGIYKVKVQQWFIKKLRIQGIKGLNRLSYKHFVMSDAGQIQNTLTGEIQRIAQAFKSYFMAFQNAILVFVYMAFAFTIDAQFAILVTIGGIITNFLYKGLYKNTKSVSRTLTGHTNIFQKLIIQNVSNYKYLKATGSIDKYGKKLYESVENIEESNKKIGQLDALLTAGREPILISVVVAVIFLQTTYFDSELGPILISLIFFYRALSYLMQLQVNWNKFLGFAGSFENWTEFSKEMKANKEKRQNDTPGIEAIGDLELKEIGFSYNKKPVLSDISLHIPAKATVAFVGESGSGKTTLVNLIAGLLPMDKGEYMINGHDSRKISMKSFQKKVGYITQDPVIFNDTIYNNVTFWSDKNSDKNERFWNALEKAAIADFVRELPEQENALLGNNGMNLSGGQKQRISIARELYKNAEILILDEATSALDSETERAIQENIDALHGNYTILIVAHRISTIKNADRIVIMNKGTIEDIGSFQELVNESSYFSKLVELQEL